MKNILILALALALPSCEMAPSASQSIRSVDPGASEQSVKPTSVDSGQPLGALPSQDDQASSFQNAERRAGGEVPENGVLVTGTLQADLYVLMDCPDDGFQD